MNQREINDVGILKTIWKTSSAGSWSVHDVQNINLRPREGSAEKFFKIKEETALMTQRPGLVIENFFATFGTTEFLTRQSIVPIVAWSDGDDEARCIGTGFFISASGLLMTAGHVIRDPIDEGYTNVTQIGERSFKLDGSLRYGVLIPVNPAIKTAPEAVFKISPSMRSAKWFMCPFEWVQHWGKSVESPLFHQKPEFRLQFDIAICKVKENIIGGSYQPLNIGQHGLSIGDRAVAIGYADMKNIRLRGDDYQPELTVSIGSVTAIYPDNIIEKRNATPGPNFEFDAVIPGKMSGSPIFVGGGLMSKGVVSRSLGSKDGHASGCLIASALSLPLVDGSSLLDMINGRIGGIARIEGVP